jgi:hypothetical protein
VVRGATDEREKEFVEAGGPAALVSLLRTAGRGEPLARALDLLVDITACGTHLLLHPLPRPMLCFAARVQL